MSEIPFAPWCRPKPRAIHVSDTLTITETTTYGYHVLAALLYLAWMKLRGFGRGGTE